MFTHYVDATALSAQFKMLRLKACLAGEALETIKGLGYSEAVYEAAKSRLFIYLFISIIFRQRCPVQRGWFEWGCFEWRRK